MMYDHKTLQEKMYKLQQDLEKQTILAQQVKCILLLHITDTLVHYQNTVIEMARSAFTHGFFMAMQNTEKEVQQCAWDFWEA